MDIHFHIVQVSFDKVDYVSTEVPELLVRVTRYQVRFIDNQEFQLRFIDKQEFQLISRTSSLLTSTGPLKRGACGGDRPSMAAQRWLRDPGAEPQ